MNQNKHSPHYGLSKYAEFDVSPVMVPIDEEFEEYIVRYVNVFHKLFINMDIVLREGMNVKI